jgi:NADH-quinone oxidoreductase subunit A
MLNDYLPVLLLSVLVVGFGVLSLMASSVLRPKRPTPAKLAPYECGITPERLPKSERFPVKFYVVAMLFIIFDIEAIFLFPWAVAFRQLGVFALVEMMVFIGLVFVAYLYVWQKGGLEWEGTASPTALRGRAAVTAMPASVERGPGERPVVSEDVRSTTAPADGTLRPGGAAAPVESGGRRR